MPKAKLQQTQCAFMPELSNQSLLSRALSLFTVRYWLPFYTLTKFRQDLFAGLTVGVMLIPQGMAYALLAGMPPIYGLYASVIPLLVYPFFGTSRHLAVGTIAIDMLIISAGLSQIAEPSSETYIALAVLLAMMVGAIQITLGLLRFGFIVNLLSRPVIAGFTSAAAIIIGLSQLDSLFGLSLPRTDGVHELLWAFISNFSDVHLLSTMVGFGGIILLLLSKKIHKLIPGPLVVVAIAIGVTVWLSLNLQGLKIVADIPSGLPNFAFPAIDFTSFKSLLQTAITLALVQFMSVISLGKVFAAKHRYTIGPNRELIAIGASNFFGSFFQSMPISGSFSRTAVNEQAGAATPISNIISGLFIAVVLLYLTDWFYYLPIPILAGIIMVAAFGMVNAAELRLLLQIKRNDGIIALITFGVTLTIGIQAGVLTGITASVIAIMYRISRPNVAELGHLKGTRSFRDISRHPEAKPIANIYMIRVDASLTFANADYLKDLVLDRSGAHRRRIKAVLIDASSINDIDTTAVAVLHDIADALKERDIAFLFGGVHGQTMDTLVSAGLYQKIGASNFCLSPHRAVSRLLKEWDRLDEYLETVPGGDSDDIAPDDIGF